MQHATETIVGQVRHTYTKEMIEASKTIAGAWEGRFATHEYELVMARDNPRTIAFRL